MRDTTSPTDLDLVSSERPARILAFLFIALAPCPLIGHPVCCPDPRRSCIARADRAADRAVCGHRPAVLTHALAVDRPAAGDRRPGLEPRGLLGTILIMGVSHNPNDVATFLAGATLIPIAVGLTQRRGHATVAAGLTVLATVAVAEARSGVARRPDRRVHKLRRLGSGRRDRRPGTPPVPLGPGRSVAARLRRPSGSRPPRLAENAAFDLAASAARELTGARGAAVVSTCEGSIEVLVAAHPDRTLVAPRPARLCARADGTSGGRASSPPIPDRPIASPCLVGAPRAVSCGWTC